MTRTLVPFFNGIVLVAREIKPADEVLTLRRDAEDLSMAWSKTDVGTPYNILSLAKLPHVSEKAKIAQKWLTYRDVERSRDLSQSTLDLIEELEPGILTVAGELFELWKRHVRTRGYGFAETFAGAQFGLEQFAHIPQSTLREDRDDVDRCYPDIVRRYADNGTPENAAQVLLTNEYVFFRAHHASGGLIKLRLGSLWGEDRYGYLEVHTEPPGAAVTVDLNDWGESPTGYGVPAGSHRVVARKNVLSGEDEVLVEAARTARVNIKLSLAPQF